MTIFQPLFLGGTGRVGQALARLWPQIAEDRNIGPGIWQYRGPDRPQVADETLRWDILREPAPELTSPVSAVILLAGVMGSDPEALAMNVSLAKAAAHLARRQGNLRLITFSTQAVYGRQTGPITEASPCHPENPYGHAKLEMEKALETYPFSVSLRIGNVFGTDTLSRTAESKAVTLDRFPDGRSPRRSYIGPLTLGRVLARLLDPELDVPSVLNVASPGVFAMGTLLEAAGVSFETRPAPESALPELELDVTALAQLVPGLETTAEDLVAEARAGGWNPL